MAGAAAAVAVLVAVVAVTGLLAPEPVTALGELATIAERREAVATAEGEFAYTRATEVSTVFIAGEDIGLEDRSQIAFRLPVERERWQAANGDVFERETIGQPEFSDAEAAAAFVASGRADDYGVGQVVDNAFEGRAPILDQRAWPTETDALLTAMRSWVSNEGNAVSETASMVELAAELLRDPGASAELRSAVLRVLDELGLETAAGDEGRRTTVGIQYVDGQVLRLELQFDAEANLVSERLTWVNDVPELGIAAGTVISQAEYSPVRVVRSIDGS